MGNGEWESKFLVPTPHFPFPTPYFYLSGRAVQPRSGLD
jgi:hypothetical protein